MSYFIYTNTEEELKNQYRKLLIKYDYKSGKNQSIIDSITKEYEAMLKKVRYDNGYRTLGQKVVESINKYVKQVADDEEQEQARISALENRKYTVQDLSNMLVEMKRAINNAMYTIVKPQGDTYEMMKGVISGTKGGEQVYLHFMKIHVGCLSEEERLKFHKQREEIEYCVFSLCNKDEKKWDEYLHKVNEQLGLYMKKAFLQYEDKFGDPIIAVQAERKFKRDLDWERKKNALFNQKDFDKIRTTQRGVKKQQKISILRNTGKIILNMLK